jgi:ubiquitin-associated SH3 domain-containing protein
LNFLIIRLSCITGKYVRKDLNMPLSVPKRQGSPESFFKDCPLTILGETQAGLLGQALRSAGESNKIQHVYCSPSLRSLQTCQNILKGLEIEQSIPISLEPGLFEWLAWYQDSMPQFLAPSEMLDAGFRLREQHQYFIDFSELCDRRESAEQYYMRSHYVTQCALRCTEHIGNIQIGFSKEF